MKSTTHSNRSFGKKVLIIILAFCLLTVIIPTNTQAAQKTKSLSNAAITLSAASYTYTGYARKPSMTVKYGKKTLIRNKDYTVTYKNSTNVGKAVAIIKGKGAYSGTKKCSFKIIPKTTSITKMNARTNSITVKWKKQMVQTQGYQIQYSLKADFSKATRSVKVLSPMIDKWELSSLRSGRTYYIRIRTLSYVNEKTYCSKWSAVKEIATKQVLPSASLDLTERNAEIALQILKERLLNEGDKNFLVSPFSLYEDLAMAAGSSGGNTRAELEQYLGGALEDVNPAVMQFNSALPESIHVANSIWINQDYGQLNPDYKQLAEGTFNAQIESAEFNDETVARINDWVNEHTLGMIPSLIESLDPLEIMHLINALAFASEWQKPYDTENIRPSSFLNAAGKRENCIMLSSTEKEYVDLTDDMGVVIAYGFVRPYEDGRSAFLGILPQPGYTTADVLNMLNGTKYADMYKNKRTYINGTIYAGIPEFSLDDKIELKPYLQNAGVIDAFSENADFSGLLEDEHTPYIDKVLQKTHIEVDRYGTKAAAATDIGIKDGATPVHKDLNLILNQPFVYAIVDYETGMPYFMGVETSLQ